MITGWLPPIGSFGERYESQLLEEEPIEVAWGFASLMPLWGGVSHWVENPGKTQNPPERQRLVAEFRVSPDCPRESGGGGREEESLGTLALTLASR